MAVTKTANGRIIKMTADADAVAGLFDLCGISVKNTGTGNSISVVDTADKVIWEPYVAQNQHWFITFEPPVPVGGIKLTTAPTTGSVIFYVR